MDEMKVNQLQVKPNVSITDRVVIEDKSGTKTAELTSVQLAFSKISTYNTFTELVTSIINGNVEMGMICYTLGYHSVNDNGAGTYLITNNKDAANDSITFQPDLLKNLGIYLQLLIGENDYVTVEQFGAYGYDEATQYDDTNFIIAALESGYPVRFKRNREYLVNSSSITLYDGMNVDFNNATLKFKSAYAGFSATKNVSNITLRNLNIECSNFEAIKIDAHVCNLVVDNVNIKVANSKAISIKSMENCTFRNMKIISSELDSFNPAFLYGVNSDNYLNDGGINIFDNIIIENAHPAFDIKCTPNGCLYMNNIIYNCADDHPQGYLLNTNISKNRTCADIIISNAVTNNAIGVAYANSQNYITLENITAKKCLHLINQIHEKSSITLKGNISIDLIPSGRVYENIQGVINYQCSMNYDTDRYRCFNKQMNGSLVDTSHPCVRGYEKLFTPEDNTTLSILSDHNTSVMIDKNTQLQEISSISGGLHSQLIHLHATRLIELKNGGLLKFAQPTKKIFLGTGVEQVSNKNYDINASMLCVGTSHFSESYAKTLNVYIKPLDDSRFKLYIEFAVSNAPLRDAFGTNASTIIPIQINTTTLNEGADSSLDDTIATKLTLNELYSNDGGTLRSSGLIEMATEFNINDYSNITIQVDTAVLFASGKKNTAGTAEVSIYPKTIFDTFRFYPNGITFRKSDTTNEWIEC